MTGILILRWANRLETSWARYLNQVVKQLGKTHTYRYVHFLHLGNLFTMSVTIFSLTVFARAAGTDFSALRYYYVLLLVLLLPSPIESVSVFSASSPLSLGNPKTEYLMRNWMPPFPPPPPPLKMLLFVFLLPQPFHQTSCFCIQSFCSSYSTSTKRKQEPNIHLPFIVPRWCIARRRCNGNVMSPNTPPSPHPA